jgi:hypothetical protein
MQGKWVADSCHTVQNKEDRSPTNRDPKQGMVRGVKNNFKRKGRI